MQTLTGRITVLFLLSILALATITSCASPATPSSDASIEWFDNTAPPDEPVRSAAEGSITPSLPPTGEIVLNESDDRLWTHTTITNADGVRIRIDAEYSYG